MPFVDASGRSSERDPVWVEAVAWVNEHFMFPVYWSCAELEPEVWKFWKSITGAPSFALGMRVLLRLLVLHRHHPVLAPFLKDLREAFMERYDEKAPKPVPALDGLLRGLHHGSPKPFYAWVSLSEPAQKQT